MIKRILSLLICASVILSVAPAIVLADSTDPGYIGGTEIINYTFNNEFYEGDIAKLAIVENFDENVDGFKADYTDDGIKITRTKESGASNFVYKFAINFVTLVDNDTINNTELYKTGFSGIYGVEITFKPDFTVEKKRTDLFFNDKLASEGNIIKGPGNNSTNNLRVYTNTKSNIYWMTTKNDTEPCYLRNFISGEDYTMRLVFDTTKGQVYLYNVNSDGTYEYVGSKILMGNSISSMAWAPNEYMGQGDSLTFKNIKVYQIEENAAYAGNVAFEDFKTALQDTILVSDINNVTESFTIPSEVTAAGTVESTHTGVLSADGTVTRGFEDTEAGIKVSNSKNGIYYEKRYNLNVKAMEGVDIKTLVEYDFSNEDYVCSVNGSSVTDGYKISNTKEYGEVIGSLKTEKSSDTYTNTYYFDHLGAYDYEISLVPEVTDGKAVVEVGNYSAEADDFIPFGTVKIYNDKIVYCDKNGDVVVVEENTTGKNYNIKFRTYTDEKKLWIYVNSNAISILPYNYDAEQNVLNAYRVTFEDATEKDSIIINSGILTQLLVSENAMLDSCMSAADSISISDITSNPTDAYGNIYLPTVVGYNVEWISSSPLADLENGYIFRTTEDTDIVLSVLISNKINSEIKVLKTFKLRVLGTDDPRFLLEGALAKLVPESITNQNPKSLIADLQFPSLTEEGYRIEWDSLNDDIISDRGVINKDTNISEDTEILYKVTVISPDGSASKNVPFTVAKRGADVVCDAADISEFAEGVVTYSAKVSNTNGSMYLHDGNDNKIIGFSVADSKLTFDNGHECTVDGDSFTLKAVMNSVDHKVSVFVNDKLELDYVAYTEKVNGFKTAAKNKLTINDEKVIFDEYSLFDYNVKIFDYFDNIGEGYINSDIVLKTNSIGGVNVVWTSSDNGVLGNDGTYTVQDNIGFFNVTVRLAVNNGTSAYYENTIECVAVPSEDKNLFANADIITNINEDADNDRINCIDNNFKTYFAGTRLNENSYITIDMGGLNDINSLYFFRDADDNNLKSCDIYVSENGTDWDGPVASASFSDSKSNHVKFDLYNARYIKVANIVTESDKIKLYEIKGYVSYSSDDKAYKDIEALDMPTEYELKADSITLPSKGLVYGSDLEWKSSDESVISKTGKVTKPSGKQVKKVVLTVKATYEGKTSVKSFKYLVAGDGKTYGGVGSSGGGGGNIAGVNTGGITIAALPTDKEIIQEPSQDNLKTEFNDVKTNDWFYTYLMKLKNKGIINGYEDGNFYPNNKITREEFVKMLVNVAGFELVEEYEGFGDVSKDDWFAPYVYTAKKLNIVSGIDESNFGVGSPISRQDMSVMIYNVVTMKKDVSASKDKFADDSTIADYASDAVYSMKALGILDGYEDRTFKPQGNLTRAEASKVISMLMDMQ